MAGKCCEQPLNARAQKCPHLSSFKANGGTSTFQIIEQYLQSSKFPHMKIPRPQCNTCNTYTGRLHACLQCVFFACWELNHLKDHFDDSNHFLGVDVTHHEVYCYQCKDYVYDTELDEIVNAEANIAIERNQSLLEPSKAKYHPWEASEYELSNLGKNSQPLKIPKNVLGLRGLINLGNTCFMNCILQSFVHNPLMRNYFLSDRHNNKECRQKFRNNLPDKDGTRTDVCLGCEMDILFEQIFSGSKTPYTPHHLLHSIWKFANYFAGYEQQDAHEFLISSLNGLHTHLERTDTLRENHTSNLNTNHNHNNHANHNHNHNDTSEEGGRCNCIVHTIFKGILRSEVTCSSCGFTSATEDPFFDISLDIPKPPSAGSTVLDGVLPPTTTPPLSPPQPPSPSASPLSPSKAGSKRNADEISQDGLLSPVSTSPIPTNSPIMSPSGLTSPPPSKSIVNVHNTLTACLERFTQPERLGSDEKFLCSKCHTRQESIKQLSMKSLPVVICFHLKRFEQLANSRTSNKIDTFIEFPSVLDMSPYTSFNIKPPSAKNNSNKQQQASKPSDNKSNGAGHDDNGKVLEDMLTYQLFAVVNHQGKMDTGHYTSYVKHDETWYKCDDATITVASLPHVLNSKGYLLFYMKNHLHYGPGDSKSGTQSGSNSEDDENS